MQSVAEAFAAAEGRVHKFERPEPQVEMTVDQLQYAMAAARRTANKYRDHTAVTREDLFQAAMLQIMCELQRRPDLHRTKGWMFKCAEYACKTELKKLWGYIPNVPLSAGRTEDGDEGNELEDQLLAHEVELDGIEWILRMLTKRERTVALMSALQFTPTEIVVMTGISESEVHRAFRSAQVKLVENGVRLPAPSKLEQLVIEYRAICKQQDAQGRHSNYTFKRDGSPIGTHADLHRSKLNVRKATIAKTLKRNGIDVGAL